MIPAALRFLIISCVLMSAVEVSLAKSGESGSTASVLTVRDADDDGLTLDFSIGQLEFAPLMTDQGPFTGLSIDGMSMSHNLGEPRLPILNRLISIPVGCELDVNILSSEYEDMALADFGMYDPLTPAQPSLCKSCDSESVAFEYKADIYASRNLYSLPLATAHSVGTLRSHNLGIITIAPIQYNPADHTIRVCKKLSVRVVFSGSDYQKTNDLKTAYYSPFFEPISRFVLNADSDALSRDDLTRYPVKYVIVSDRMFESQLGPFVEWKTRRGFEVVLAFTDVIGSTATEIRGFIEDLYSNGTPEDPAPSFILLVGDTPQVPTFYYPRHVSDLQYCEFTGDMFPDIYCGRFSANTPLQLQPQIDKTLEYEQHLMPDNSYMADAVLVAGVDDFNADLWINGQINYGLRHYFNESHGFNCYSWLYPESAEPEASDEIALIIGNGTGVISYSGHCTHTGFTDPSFQVEDIMDMSNAHRYGLAIGNCCLSNTFDEASPCLGEAWLRSVNTGGVGYIGASDGTHWNEDYWWSVGAGPIIGSGADYEETGIGAYDGMFHDHGEHPEQHYVTNGAIIFAGNLAVTEASTPELAQYYWEIYHLMGDPSVMTYLGIPAANNVSHPDLVLTTTTSVNVLAQPGSYIGITRDGVLHGAGYVDADGHTLVSVEPFAETGEATIVVTCQNRTPYTSTIQICDPDMAYLIIDSLALDDSSGNGDSQPDLGETISTEIHLRNDGLITADNVSGVISTQDQFVTIIDSFASFGNIDADGGTAYSSPAYSYIVGNNIPDEHIARFDLNLTADGGYMRHLQFNSVLHSPVVEIVSTTVDDPLGNDNTVLDPGETASLYVTLENAGSCDADSVSGILFSLDPMIVVLQGTGLFGGIPAHGGQAQNSSSGYEVSADPSLSIGDTVELGIAVSDHSGYCDTLLLAMQIGNIPPSLLPIGPQTVNEEDTLSITVFATNPDGDPPALTVEDLPANATFVDGGYGSGIFDFYPDLTQAGIYEVTFRASDGIDTDSETVNITVVGSFPCGDADGSGAVDIDDVVYLISYIFSGGPEPQPYEAGDGDCSGTVDIDDVVYLIGYIFAGGNPPCDTDGNGDPDC